MAKRISRRLRKLAPRRALAFMVSAGSGGSVELTLYAGRRSLVRSLSAQDAAVLAHMLTQTSQQLPDHRSTGSCGSSSCLFSSTSEFDTRA